ncbi:9cebf63e-d42d-4a08-b77c-702e00c148c2 [Sclerotinia trifoliorum]|uniref:9cebf63e-d42d-4a08-b77c-702e00c148c2 n=1 Tax=Sclerotinia trifoliorum TaxID=28548 RepID=A0A8H2VSE6_9HELO|nr:9cebf63e-d42d-4a08-b77c-702e00c148c2 [Sclerotinia trifoliorum]
MIRHGHQAKFTASGFYWNFCWGKKEKKTLLCFLSKVKRKPPQQELSSQGLDASQFKVANPWEDVSVRMGNVSGKKSKSISEAEVQDFKGKFYLKGLILEKMANSKYFRYGYDFAQGQIGQDRKGTDDPEQLGYHLAKIWVEAITQDNSKSLDIYVAMLLDTEKKWWDVSNISGLMTKTMAEAIWKRLLEQDPQKKDILPRIAKC